MPQKNDIYNQELIGLDELNRKKALDYKRSYMCEAGAGSGKTRLITERIISMIEGGIDCNNICAVTFGNKAAGEIISRVRVTINKHIDEINEQNDPDILVLERLEKALVTLDKNYPTDESESESVDQSYSNENGNFDELMNSDYEKDSLEQNDTTKKKVNAVGTFFIGTIDKYLLDLAKVYRKKSNSKYIIPAKQRDINEVVNLFVDAAVYNSECYIDGVMIGLDSTIMRRVIRRILAIMIDNVDVQFELPEEYQNLSIDKINQMIADLLDKIENEESHFNLSAKESYGIDQLISLNRDVSSLNALLDICSNKFINEDEDSYTKRYIKDYRNQCNEIKYAIAMDFCIRNFDKFLEFKKNCFEDNVDRLTFTEYKYEVLKELQNGNILEETKNTYYIIDEFQDTDPLQMRSFMYLASNSFNPVWNENVPRDGSLFVVGDPKQSIYHFRRADLKMYFNVKEVFRKNDNCEVITLYRNFRSFNKLLEYYNNTFPQEFYDGEDPDKIQANYNEIPLNQSRVYDRAKIKPLAGAFEIEFSGNANEYWDMNSNKDEYAKIRDIVSHFLHHWSLPYYGKHVEVEVDGKRQYRLVEPEDIMILARTNWKVTRIRKELESIQSDFPDCDISKIRIMTYHKSKGLQAPIVILAYSTYEIYESQYTVNYDGDIPRGQIFKITDGSGDSRKTIMETKYFVTGKKYEKNVGEAELTRLAYVARTRAVNALIISSANSISGTCWSGVCSSANKNEHLTKLNF